ncbi:hypothetical protein CHS0354_014518 [Potamilus streckersoni]|uniref:Uncharacterized protein n=1 Tax=Potamilus streckersoni TaxID=2493646 RepID=A0AAE0S9Z5_9BIVA|nr:hypothetical protein CHS0354_014518 [Potamilus streckersoni]
MPRRQNHFPLNIHTIIIKYSTQNRRAKSNGNGNTAGGTESGNEANEVENETASGGQGFKPLPRPNNNFRSRSHSIQGAYNEPYHYEGSSWNDRSTRTLRRYGSDFGMQNAWNDARSGYTVGPYDNSWNDGFTTTSTSTSSSSPHYPDTTEDD